MEKTLQLKIVSDRSQARRVVQEEIADLGRVREANSQMHAEKLRMMRQAASEQIAATRQSSQGQLEALRQIRAAGQLQQQEWRAQTQAKMREDRAASQAMIYNMNQIRRSLQEMRADFSKGVGAEGLKSGAEGLNAMKESAGGAGAAIKGMIGQFVGFQAAQQLLRGVVEEMERVRKAAADASKEVTGNRGDVRELATLRGNAGDTTTTMKDLFNFRRQTGQTQQEAIAFQTAALGAGESAIGRQVSREDFETFMAQSAAFGTMGGINADTMGTLAGNLPSLVAKPGQKVGAGELMGRTRQLESIFKPGAGTYGQLTDQLLKTSAFSRSGVYKDVADQAALLSYFSLTNKEGAGTMVEQFTRATAGGLGRMRGMPMMAGVGAEESQKQAEYLGSIGATEAMDPIQIGTKIAEDMRSQRAQKGKDFNSFTYLQSKGYANIEDVQTLMAFEGGLETFQQGFLPLARGPVDASGKNLADVRRFQQFDPMAANRRAELANEEATFVAGAGKGEAAEIMRRDAFAKMKAEGRAYGTYEEYTARHWMPGESSLRRQTIDFEAMRALNQQLPEASRQELPTETGWGLGAWGAEGHRRRLIGELSERSALEGQGLYTGQRATGDRANEMADNIRRIAEMSAKQAAKMATAPPLRPPVRPQAAPIR